MADTGKGIPADQVDKIFDRFYRAEASESKGSGIGLALTKELVELSNGNIKVESQYGQGTVFKIELPIDIDLLPESQITIVHNDSAIHTTIRDEPTNERAILPTVLVVEDNEDLRTYIADILKAHYKVELAKDGVSGFEKAKDHIPNIIVSDVMMPKRDGYELCKMLKQNDLTNHIPVILLTAKAGQENKMSGLTHGADAYMTKPFEAEELLLRIQNFIAARNKIWEQFNSIGAHMADLSLHSIDDQFYQKVSSIIQDNISNEQFTVEDLAKKVNFSRSQLHRKLKAIINKSANQLIREIRLQKARVILNNNSMTVSETAYSVGYSNLSYFTKAFKSHFGYLPSDLKEQYEQNNTN